MYIAEVLRVVIKSSANEYGSQWYNVLGVRYNCYRLPRYRYDSESFSETYSTTTDFSNDDLWVCDNSWKERVAHYFRGIYANFLHIPYKSLGRSVFWYVLIPWHAPRDDLSEMRGPFWPCSLRSLSPQFSDASKSLWLEWFGFWAFRQYDPSKKHWSKFSMTLMSRRLWESFRIESGTYFDLRFFDIHRFEHKLALLHLPKSNQLSPWSKN